MTEITTRAEKGLQSMETPGGAPEPKLTLTQLRGLLQDAAALERAQRPIVLNTSSAPTTAPQAGGHGGIDVRVPAPPVTTAATPHAPKERNVWPLAFTASLVGVVTSAAAAAATGSPYAVLAVFAFVSAWGATTYHLVFERA